MKQNWTIGIVILIAMLIAACSGESERMADMVDQMVRSFLE